jgi:hypothetical protein
MKGSHDDLIMALGMCLFVANNSFRKLSESVNSTKAMIDSWKVNTNNIQTTSNTMLQEATKLVTENNYGQNNDIYGNNKDFPNEEQKKNESWVLKKGLKKT